MGDNIENFSKSRSFRLLDIYAKLHRGEVLKKTTLSDLYNVSEKTIQRDINDIRAYMSNTNVGIDDIGIIYDKSKKGYKMIV